MYHNWSKKSPIDGYLGCGQYFAITNSAAVKNLVHVTFCIYLSSRFPEVGLLDQK